MLIGPLRPVISFNIKLSFTSYPSLHNQAQYHYLYVKPIACYFINVFDTALLKFYSRLKEVTYELTQKYP